MLTKVQVIVLLQIVLDYHLFQVLWLSLEYEQHIVFVGGEEANAIEQGGETELTAFFKLNAQEKEKHMNNFVLSSSTKSRVGGIFSLLPGQHRLSVTLM